MSETRKTQTPIQEIFVSLQENTRWTEAGEAFAQAYQLERGRRTMDVIREFQIYLPPKVAAKYAKAIQHAEEKKFRQPDRVFRVRFNAKGKWHEENTVEYGKMLFFIMSEMDTPSVAPIFEYHYNRPSYATA